MPKAALVRAIAHLFTTSVQALDKSTHGWWRFIAIVFALAIAGSLYSAGQKIDPLKFFEGRELDCPVVDGQWRCDR